MPRIPTADLDTEFRERAAPGQASIAGAQSVGRAITTVGTAVQDVGEQFAREDAQREVVDLEAKATRDLADFENSLEGDTDYRTMEARLAAFQQEWGAQNLQGRRQIVVDAATPRLTRLGQSALNRTRDRARVGQIGASLGELDDTIDGLITGYANTEDAALKREFWEAGQTSIRQREADGIISSEEARNAEQSYRNMLGEIDGEQGLRLDPRGFREALQDPAALPTITGTQRTDFQRRAEAAVKALDREAEQNRRSQESEEKARRDAANEKIYADFRVAVSRFQPGRQQPDAPSLYNQIAQAEGKGQLKPGQAATLTISLDERWNKYRDDAATASFVAEAISDVPGAPLLDPRNNDHRDAVDKYYAGVLQPGLERSNASPDQVNATTADFIIRANGIVPKTVQSGVRAALIGGSSDEAALAADLVARVQGSPEGALAGSFDSKDIALADTINDLIRVGVSPTNAVERARTTVDPDNQALMSARDEELRTSRPTDKFAGWITERYDTWTSLEPDMPTTGGVRARILQEYGASYDNWFRLTGDEQASKDKALDDLGRTWGITEVAGGGRRLMKYPPEALFGIEGYDNAWIERQLVEAVSEVRQYGGRPVIDRPPRQEVVRAGMVPMGLTAEQARARLPSAPDAFLVSDQTTAREVTTGSPSYKIMVRQDGVFVEFVVDGAKQRFIPDRDAEVRRLEQEENRDQRRSAVEARARRDADREQINMLGASPLTQAAMGS